MTPLLLVRHGWAGDRIAWTGDDRLRPLDERGRRQARSLADALPPLLAGVKRPRLLTSPYLRCTQTLDPLATALGAPVEERDELAEGSGDAVLSLLSGLAGGSVLCTHGDVIETLVGFDRPKKKGSVWLLEPDPATRAGWAPVRYLKPAG